jgi:hypothetical protein
MSSTITPLIKAQGKKLSERQSALHLGIGYLLEDSRKEKLIDIYQLNENRKGHTLVIGGMRSTLLQNMIVQDIRAGRSVGLIDPNEDPAVWEAMVREAREVGREKELVYISAVYPEFSVRTNLLAYSIADHEIIQIIMACVSTNDKLFNSVALEIATLIAKTLLLERRCKDYPNKAINFEDVFALASIEGITKCKEIAKSLSGLEKDAKTLCNLADNLINAESDCFTNILTAFRATVAQLLTGRLKAIIGSVRDNVLVQRLESQERAIFYVGSFAAMNDFSKTMSRALIAMLQSLAGRLAAKRRPLETPLCLYIDGCDTVIYRGIESFFTYGGEANFYLTAFASWTDRLEAAIGVDRARAIFDNTDTKVFTRTICRKTAQYLSAYKGVVTPEEILSLKDREFYCFGLEGEFRGELTASAPVIKETDPADVKTLADTAKLMIRRNFLYNG